LDRPADPVDELPDAVVEAFDHGMHAFIQREYAEAAASFETALAGRERFDDAQYMLALAKLRLGEPDEAKVLLAEVAAKSENVMLRDYAASKLNRLASPSAQSSAD